MVSMRRLLGVLIFAVGIAASAQQGSAAKSSSPSQTSQPSSASSAPSQSSQNAAKVPNQPPPSTPDDLRFPEEDSSQSGSPSPPAAPAANLAPPLSDEVRVQDLGPAVGDSSSKDTPVDLSAPADDAKTHPKSAEAVAHAEADSLGEGGITELHAWDPHTAAKDVEVGDFYYRRGNYRAAEARYRDALLYKENDAIATFHLAECLEKMGILDDARAQYESYLKILPHGPEAEKAEKGIARLKAETESR
jgi:tetratricopeptide (TPR) repeat protein